MSDKGTHMSHCYQGENKYNCKYMDTDCPAQPKEDEMVELEMPKIICPKCKSTTPINPYYDDWTCSNCKITFTFADSSFAEEAS